MKPMVAVTSDLKFIDTQNWQGVPANYVDAVANVSGTVPVIVPSIGDRLDIDELLDRVDGVLVTGSRSNVHPSHYDVEANDDHQPFDPARDETTLPLIRRAIERGIPLLAICRGIQELNVALGGSITAQFQKHRNIENHEYPLEGTLDERFAISHPVKVKPGSCLAAVLGDEVQNDRISVNSLHTQALDRLGENVVVEATAEDGTIEAVAIEGAKGFVVGVQWHPEYWAATDGPSNRILTAFGDAARAYVNEKSAARIAAQ